MRALIGDRLLGSAAGRKSKARKSKAPRPRVTKRRKPPPPWRKPAILGGAALVGVLVVASGAYGVWSAGYPRQALAWAERASVTVQVGVGLTVEEVIARGRERTPREVLLRALDVRRGQPILGVDLEAAKARLEAIGWVKSATISRRLPGIIEVRIAERRPLALWQRRDGLALIGDDGAVITVKDLGRFRELPIVVGKEAPSKAADLLTVLRRQPQLFERVEAAIRVSGRRWNVRLKGGVEIRLPEGGERQAWDRLAALDRDHRILARHLVAIDMRLPDRLIVRMAPGAAARFREPGEKT